MITKLKKFKVVPIMVCLLAIIVVSSTVHAAEVSNEKNIGVSFIDIEVLKDEFVAIVGGKTSIY